MIQDAEKLLQDRIKASQDAIERDRALLALLSDKEIFRALSAQQFELKPPTPAPIPAPVTLREPSQPPRANQPNSAILLRLLYTGVSEAEELFQCAGIDKHAFNHALKYLGLHGRVNEAQANGKTHYRLTESGMDAARRFVANPTMKLLRTKP